MWVNHRCRSVCLGIIHLNLRDPVSAKLLYTDTGYGHVVQHHQRTSSQFCNLLYNKFTTNGQKFATSQHLGLQLVVSLSVGGVVQHVRSRCP